MQTKLSKNRDSYGKNLQKSIIILYFSYFDFVSAYVSIFGQNRLFDNFYHFFADIRKKNRKIKNLNNGSVDTEDFGGVELNWTVFDEGAGSSQKIKF